MGPKRSRGHHIFEYDDCVTNSELTLETSKMERIIGRAGGRGVVAAFIQPVLRQDAKPMALLLADFDGLPSTVAARDSQTPRNPMHLFLEEKIRMETDLFFALAHRLPTYDLGRAVLPAELLTYQWLDHVNFPGPLDHPTIETDAPVVGPIVTPLAADRSAATRRRAHE